MVQRSQYLWNNDLRVSAVSTFYPRSPLYPISRRHGHFGSYHPGATSLSAATADWSRFLFFIVF